ncbi:MAG: DUF1983 domain-containing protein, partial [Castellaniella sp.]
MRMVLETRFGRTGSKMDKVVTWADLIDKGLVLYRSPTTGQVISGGSSEFLPPTAPVVDGIPPAPTGLVVTPGLALVMLEWDRVQFGYFGYAEIWRHTEDNLAGATLVGQTTAWLYTDHNVEPGQTYWYWVRYVSAGGKPGPYNALSGTSGGVSHSPDYVLELLRNQIDESAFVQALGDRIDLVDIRIFDLLSEIGISDQAINDARERLFDQERRLANEIDDRANESGALRESIAQTAVRLLQEVDDRQLSVSQLKSYLEQRLSVSEGEISAILGTAEYDENETYDEGALTRADGKLYRALQAVPDHTPPPDESYWEELGDYSSFSDALSDSLARLLNVESVQSGQAIAIGALTSRVGTSEGSIISLQETTGETAQSLGQLTARVGGNEFAIGNLALTTGNQASQLGTLSGRVDGAEGDIEDLQEVTGTHALTLGSLTFTQGEHTSSINTLQTAMANTAVIMSQLLADAGDADGAITTLQETSAGLARSLTQLRARMGDDVALLQQEMVVQASATGGLLAQWAVKTDINGRVTGFGLASTKRDGAPLSEFAVVADRFSVAIPGDTGQTKPVFVIGMVDEEPTVVFGSAMFGDATITRAAIGLLAVDNARIANMSVDKLLAGSLQADQYIQSTSYVAGQLGFRLSANGNAELNNAVLRGTIYATAGLIGGNTITSTEVKSPTFSEGSAGWRLKSSGDVEFNNGTFRGALDAATGSFKGSLDAATGSFKGALDAATGSFKGTVDGGAFVVGDFTSATWPASGKSGAYLGPVGLRIGNYNDGKYFEVLQNGNVYAPGLSIVNGLMTISAIDVIDTLQIAGQAVTTAVSYSTDSSGGGSFSFYTSVSAYVYLFVRGRPVYQSVVPGSSSTTVMAAISG